MCENTHISEGSFLIVVLSAASRSSLSGSRRPEVSPEGRLDWCEDDSSLFDSLNQDILNLGFTTQTLSRLETLTRQVNDVTALSERIPQAQQSCLSKGSTVLTAAAIICRGCSPTESDVRQIYDTDDLVGDGRIQERLVELDISSINQLKQTLR